jgi:hypothetical protein
MKPYIAIPGEKVLERGAPDPSLYIFLAGKVRRTMRGDRHTVYLNERPRAVFVKRPRQPVRATPPLHHQ